MRTVACPSDIKNHGEEPSIDLKRRWRVIKGKWVECEHGEPVWPEETCEALGRLCPGIAHHCYEKFARRSVGQQKRAR